MRAGLSLHGELGEIETHRVSHNRYVITITGEDSTVTFFLNQDDLNRMAADIYGFAMSVPLAEMLEAMV